MAIAGDPTVFATLGFVRTHLTRSSLPPSKLNFASFSNGGSARNVGSRFKQNFGTMGDNKLSMRSISQEANTFLLNAINMSFFERLKLAWKIVFPSPTERRSSNANIAKQRLKMILFSDRCAVSDEAKRKIVNNIIHALSDFVEIESRDKVQLNVSTDSDLGTVYSVAVPVRRVKQEYQDEEDNGAITNIEYKDTGEKSGSVDVTFDFFVPNENGP